ncbi:DUF3429 domain-containing protein [Sphingomonas sp. S2-65]|uniref:DUF3429 domain-containing protein n=1 Tax=Sphingomonas sp. S2-65 TaxID=2903960 RepID=UPI001F313E99|nr:DUF3429 family protein [Sphingomonas sp. S2-65]UYY59829.1 DUF3429 family protein [Sphingomonas sp. S2-65]
MHASPPRTPRLDTPARIPPLSLVLGYGPMLVILLLGIGAWTLRAPVLADAALVWSAAILLFLSGVARGLSFFTEGGPRLTQLATMGLRFGLGVAALALPLTLAWIALIFGYASLAITEPPAARHGEAPSYFAQLRPIQALIAVAGLVLCLLAG